jgi:tetratricopeptide (TPR) repeat protein
MALSLHQLGMIAQDQGDYEMARRLYEQSLEIRRQLGDQAGMAFSLGQLGVLAQDQGDHATARRLYEQSLKIFERLKSPYAETARKSLAGLEKEKK